MVDRSITLLLPMSAIEIVRFETNIYIYTYTICNVIYEYIYVYVSVCFQLLVLFYNVY